MRGGGALVAGCLVGALILTTTACAGSDGDATDTTPPPVTAPGTPITVTGPPATDPPATDPPATDPPGTSAAPTTVAPATEASTTTLDDEAATLAAVEQAYFDAHAAYLAAARDPSNPELRAEIARLFTGPNLERTTELLDSFVDRNYVAKPDPKNPSRTEVLAPAQFVNASGSLADLVVCDVNTETFYETGAAPDGSDALVTDEVTVRRLIVLLELTDGQWQSRSGDRLADLSNPIECPI